MRFFNAIAIFSVVVATSAFAAWRGDLDNSMEDATGTIKGAMGILWSGNGGKGVAVQVCPGVYLTTAHGALDDPNKARNEDRPLRSPMEAVGAIYSYPLSEGKWRLPASDASIISPYLDDPSHWGVWPEAMQTHLDYAFIAVENPQNPNDYVTPVNYEPDHLHRLSGLGELDVHLIRPKTRYQLGPDGSPVTTDNKRGMMVFDDTTVATGEAFWKLLDRPQKVVRRCDLYTGRHRDMLFDNCPTEKGISGAPYLTEIGGAEYLVGINVSSQGNVIVGPLDGASSAFVPAKNFCADYERACGQPCVQLEDVLE